MNTHQAFANLVDVVKALEASGATPFLVDGTLLGAVRERDFIAHDGDVDLGVLIEHYDPLIPAAVERRGLRHSRTFGSPGLGLELAFRRRGVKVDVFFYYADERGRYHAAWPKDGRPIRYDYWLFGLAPLHFLGRDFLAPDDPERFLATKYGPEWREPVTEWDWAWGPRNARAWDA